MIDAQRLAVPDRPLTYREGMAGIAAGSLVFTTDGALPVEHILPGDRVITRNGARVLKSIQRVAIPAGTPVIAIQAGALGGTPEADIWVLPSQGFYLRDWRAKALTGRREACVPAVDLIDGAFIRWATAKAGAACLMLDLGGFEILYADGVEMAAADPILAKTG